MIKRIAALALAMSLLVSAGSALADDYKQINSKEKRGIKLTKVTDNKMQPGISPTTGLRLSDYEDIPDTFLGLAVTGEYLPMLVQIDNSDGGVENLAQWGMIYSDLIYESPLYRTGQTRLSVLYSDLLPDDVGPVRSARVGHVYLAAEWYGGFVHYGGQTKEGSNINDVMKKVGIKRNWNRFDGTDGAKDWNKYFNPRKNRPSPHNRAANVAGLSTLVNSGVKPVNHTFLFTDELPTAGDEATEIRIDQGMVMYNSHIVYDAAENCYYRYMADKNDEYLYTDRDTEEPVVFANVIIQWTEVPYNGSKDAPVMKMVGEGNADIFIGGRHIAGYWKHASADSRTVFYDAQGKEIELQRGRTLISILDYSKGVSYK